MQPERLNFLIRRLAAIWLAITAGIVSLAGLGWLANNPVLMTFGEKYFPIPPASILSFLFLSGALWVYVQEESSPVGGRNLLRRKLLRRAALVSAALVAALSLLVLLDQLTGLGAGFERALFGLPPTENMAGRMSPVIAVMLLLSAGVVLLLLLAPAGHPRASRLAAWGGMLLGGIGAILALWYGYGTPFFYDTGIVPPSLPAALALISFGLSLIYVVTPYLPALRFYYGDAPQARLVRALIPAVIALFLLENWVEDFLLPDMRLGGPTWALAVTVVGTSIAAAVIWLIARSTGSDLERVQDALRASEQRFYGIVEHSVDGVTMTDERGLITEWNVMQEAITGLPAQAVLGRPLWEVQAQFDPSGDENPARLESLRAMLERVLQTGDGSAIARPTEIPFRRTDGSQRFMQSVSFPIPTAQGHVLCILARDVTRRKQADEALFWELAENAALSSLYKPLIAANTTLNDVADAILAQAQSLTGSLHGYVSVVDPLTRANILLTLTSMMEHCLVKNPSDRVTSFPVGADGKYNGLWGYALNTRQAFYTNDSRTHPAVRGVPEGHIAVEQFLSAPVLLGDELVGQIALTNPGRDYGDHDLEAIKRLGEYYALAIQRHRTETALKGEHENLQKVFQAVPVGMLLLNDRTEIVQANTTFGTIVLREPEDLIGRRLGDGLRCVHSGENERGCGFSPSCPFCPLRRNVEFSLTHRASVRNVEACMTLELTAGMRPSDGKPELRWININAEPVIIDKEQHVIVAIEDISARKQTEAALQRSEERYRLLFSQMSDGFALHEIICSEDGKPVDYRFLEVNPAFEQQTSLKASELIGKQVRQLMPQTEDYWIETYGKVALSQQSFSLENYSQALGRWYQVLAFSPKPGQFATLIKDITERKQSELRLQEMLHEKDILLKEVHHRVKNNLQIVNSLISLYADTVEDPVAVQAFQDCRNNIRAISLVHENIYRSQNLAQIDADDYLPGLLHHLQMALGRQSGEVKLHLDIQPVSLDVDDAIPCGLIVTELFTNAFKHAFPPGQRMTGDQSNELWVEFGLSKNHDYCLSVRDNGIGLPANFDLHQGHSLGLQLVDMMARQLKGKLEIGCDSCQGQGSCFQVSFPR